MRFFILLIALGSTLVLNAQSKTIFRHACDGNRAQLDSLLQTTDINVRSKNESNLLHFAAYCSQEAVFHELIERGIDLQATNKYGDSPLMYAVLRRNLPMTQALLERKVDVNTMNTDSLTPLFNAVQADQKELVTLLIQAGADIDLGKPLLHKAVLNNSLEVVKQLIGEATDIDARNEYGNTPLALALREDNMEIAEFLLKQGADKTKVPSYHKQGDYLGEQQPDSIPLLFSKGFIATENFEHSPTFSPDGKELYYTVESWRYHGGTVFVTEQDANGTWSSPKPMAIDGDYREIDPFLSADGNTLYYCTDRPLMPSDSTRTNCDMWLLQRKEGGWSAPRYMGEQVNSGEHHDWFPTLSNDGTLYFSTGPNRTSNIVYTESKDGVYQAPQDLGPAVNSESRDYDPTIAPDQSFLIFSSNRANGYGSVDLYISFRDAQGEWTEAKNMGPLINTNTIEFAPRLSPDGRFLFFNREGSIYWVSTKGIASLKD